MKTHNGFMLFSGGSCQEITLLPNGTLKVEHMIGQEATEEIASTAAETNSGDYTPYENHEYQQYLGLQPELFFKMSHDIYNYGEGLIGKVAADHSHKWIFKEPNDQEINFLSTWNNSADSHPRTWEAQFQAGIKTIALVAIREGVIQLGSIHKGRNQVTHLLQHTLRSFCIHENSQWVYAVFWRILPRNYPPPKWDTHGGAYDRSRGNRRNWILAWEDGFCNFAASTAAETNSGDYTPYENHEYQQYLGLQPELFFKMSHDIYNYGEGLIGKVAADHSHKWIFKEPNDQEINFLSTWNNSADSHPRTWEAQFQAGIKTIALVAIREGVIQLGSIHKGRNQGESWGSGTLTVFLI
nr:protein rice salt sensitive 3-like [Tanacetum cinerariifolium]